MKTKDFDLESELRVQAKKIPVDVPRDLSRTICAAIASTVAEGPSSAASFNFSSRSAVAGGERVAPEGSARGGDWDLAGFAGAVRRHWTLWAGLTGAVAAAFVGLFVFRAPTAQVDTHAEAVALAQEVQGVPQRVLASLATDSAGTTQEDPLHEEATALAGSAQSALGFLAYNFLPVSNG